MKFKYFLLVCFVAILSLKGAATHIVGGEIYYDCLGANKYKITLKVYRDCTNPTNAAYDNPAYIFIFNSSGGFLDSIRLPLRPPVFVPATINNPCFTPPAGICVQETIYDSILTLPPLAGGYDIVYERCCRNHTILNIINPGDVGSTYLAHIPDPALAICNSSPRYNHFPPLFLCANVPLFFDHSATDPDGDSLYYEFCDPFDGATPCCPRFGIPVLSGSISSGCAPASTCPVIPAPPPFAYIPWLPPYNASYPMSSSPAMLVNPTTGLMTGTPNMIGQWVVGVCVSEFRNGILLSVNKRDFQFNVVNCPGLPVASIPNQTTFCVGYNVNFSQTSMNASSYQWDFGDPTTTADVSSAFAPSWTYTDSGTYLVTLIINPGTLCADTNTTVLRVYPLLDPLFSAPSGECIYENSFNFTGAGSYMGNGTFTWDFGAHATPMTSSTENPTNVVYDTSGTFPVTFTVTENGCTDNYVSSVQVNPKPIANYTLGSPVACDLQPVLFLDGTTVGGPFSYFWTFGDGSSSSEQNPWHIYPGVGTYASSVIVSTMYGCKDTFALPAPVNVFPSPVAGLTASPTDTSIFYPLVTVADISSGAVDCSIYWGDGSSSANCDTAHAYSHPGTFTIMQVVVNASGCWDTAFVHVVIEPEYLFWIPNAFTPNSNGLNDVFKPSLIGVHNYSFLIFDRWGEKIFETNNPEVGWNGYFRGHLCTNDVFVYKINFVDDVQQLDHQFIGRVTLVR